MTTTNIARPAPSTKSSWTSLAAGVARLGAGYVTRVSMLGPRPEKRLELYDFEACPYCRRVRETLSELDLEVMIWPCPRRGERYRPEIKQLSSWKKFPQLRDPNTGAHVTDSQEIIRYLYRHYGTGRPPLTALFVRFHRVSSFLASALRVGHGRRARPSRTPEQPLELWGYETSRYCRLVREVLCELEIPYVQHNIAKKSPSRAAFVERVGKMQVPWLRDPNTGAEMFESADIIAYLEERYGDALPRFHHFEEG